MQKLLDYLTKRDGAVTRNGKAMTRIVQKTGYSVEAVRSFAYGRRTPRECERLEILRKMVARG